MLLMRVIFTIFAELMRRMSDAVNELNRQRVAERIESRLLR